MTSAVRIIGNHVWFAREGAAYTIPSSGTVAREAKPGPTDTSWTKINVVERLSVSHQRDQKEVFSALPGALRRYDILEQKRKLDIKFVGAELSPIMIELIFGALALTGASTQFNPLEGASKRGWLKIQQYDQSDTLINTVDVYGVLMIESAEFADDIVKPEWSFATIHSSLNTGTL